MGKKRFKYLSLVLCVVLICGSFVYIPKKNDVKAFLPIAAGPAVVLSIMISMGFIVTSENAQRMATDIYNGLDSSLQDLADIKGEQVNIGGMLTPVSTTRAQYDAIVQAIANKMGWGTNPPASYTKIDDGMGSVQSASSYSSITNPIDILTVPTYATFTGYTGQNTVFTIGNITYTLKMNNQNGMNNFKMTLPDGTIYKRDAYYGPEMIWYSNFKFTAPVVYNYGTATPKIKFFWNTSARTQNGIDYNQTKVIEAFSYGNTSYYRSVDNGVTWVAVSPDSLYNDMKTHLTITTTQAGIDQQAYIDAVNGIGQSVDDLTLNVSTDLDKMVMYNAETVKSLDAVNNSVINLGGTITSAFQAVGTSIVNGINAITSGISTTATNIYTGVQSIATSITAAPTVALNMQPLSLAGATLATKFPFCIPFDLVNSISALNVAAVAPHWVINFDSSYFTGGGQVDIDFAQFEAWAVIIRWGLLIGFSLGLIMITRQIIGGE